MKSLFAKCLLVLAPLIHAGSYSHAEAQQTASPLHNVVLVHGAWADGSSWAKVIPLLEAKGLHVSCVQLPLTSFDDDVAATKRIIDAQDGPVLLVGHSYGGAVISEAGNDAKVAKLLFVAAYAPDEGQSTATQKQPYPPTPGRPEIKPIGDGFLVISPKGIAEDFAQDLTQEEQAVLTAVEKPTQSTALGAKISTVPAWRTKPTWFIVATQDRMIQPEQERDEAKAMHAQTLELKSSHVAMLSKPREVAAFIANASLHP